MPCSPPPASPGPVFDIVTLNVTANRRSHSPRMHSVSIPVFPNHHADPPLGSSPQDRRSAPRRRTWGSSPAKGGSSRALEPARPLLRRRRRVTMTPSVPLADRLPDGLRAEPLSPWDQVAMRSYMRTALVFPLDDAARPAAADHLRAALGRLAWQRPDFAGRLRTGPAGTKQGYVYLETGRDGDIPFEALDISADFGYTFPELREADYPPGAFVHPRFGVPCDMGEGKPPVPVAMVKAYFIAGGLILALFFHHSFADGECLRVFVASLAAQTHGDALALAANLHWQKGGESVFALALADGRGATTTTAAATTATAHDVSADDVHRLAPEYALLDGPSGPTIPRPLPGGVEAGLIPKTGKTFVFDNATLQALRRAVQEQAGTLQPPSNYVVLAALAWAHLSRARLADVAYVPRGGPDSPARLQTMVNWKARTGRGGGGGGGDAEHFGNATIVAVTRLATRRVVDACQGPRQLGLLTSAIEATIGGIDGGFVDRRTRLFDALPDPRRLGLDFDPRTPQDLGFNTWRYFGADTEWRLTGGGGGGGGDGRTPTPAPPAAMRRVQDVWNMSGALILPARCDATVHELLVTLPATAMGLLCQDSGWMKWVAKTVG